MAKICITCKKRKYATAFSPDKRRRDGLQSECRTCKNKKGLNRYHTDEKFRQRVIETAMKSRFKRIYGITLANYQQMLMKQNHVCLICGQPESRIICDKLTQLCVEHDHKTGKVRGLVCHNCNQLLRYASDSVEVLQRTIRYLEGVL